MAKGQGSGAVYGCAPTFSKYILFILNILFFVSGIGLIIFGGILIGGVSPELVHLGNYTTAIGGIVVALGIFTFLTSFFGCCGALRESAGILKIYVGTSVLAILVEIALVITLSVPYFVDRLLVTEGKPTFMGMDDPTKAQFEGGLKCCGWKSWEDSYTKGTIPDQCYPDNVSKNVEHVYIGCEERVRTALAQYSNISIGLGVGVILIQVVANVMSIIMWRNIKKENMYV